MQSSEAVPPDPAAMVYRHHEQLYRLALLLAGDADNAAKLVERAYRQLPADAPNAEAQLIRGLLHQRVPRGRGTPRIDSARLGYAPLDRDRAAALLGAVATMPAPVRLAAGLHYLRGMGVEEIERLLVPTQTAGELSFPRSRRNASGDRGVRAEIPVSETLTQLRVATAHALSLVPPEIDDAQLAAIDRWLDARLPNEAATALRRAAFEQPAVRAACSRPRRRPT
jgi:hypothetical protein